MVDQPGLVRRGFIGLFTALAFMSWGLLLSLQPAFYPTEAESKGATPSQYGFVFGVVSLAAFIAAPTFAHFGNRMGPKLVYNVGSLTMGISGIAFGLLELIDQTAPFIGLSYFLRFVEGVATAASMAALLSFLMQLFPAFVSSITAYTEMFTGLGYMFGPSVGSALYSAGGFGLPFYVVGSLIVVSSLVLRFLLPRFEGSPTEEDDQAPEDSSPLKDSEKQVLPLEDKDVVLSNSSDIEESKPTLTVMAVVKSLTMLLPYIDNFVVFSGNGMLEAMLEPHLKDEAGATQWDVAFTFLVMGGCYMVTSPLTGCISDRLKYPVVLSVVGNVLMLVSFSFLGPLPFLPFLPTVPLIMAMCGLAGTGYALIMVASFGRAHRSAMEKGFADNIATSMTITGLWTASFHFGNFVGPTASGFMVETWGFRSTTLVFLAVYALMTAVNAIDLFYKIGRERGRQTKQGYQEIKDSVTSS